MAPVECGGRYVWDPESRADVLVPDEKRAPIDGCSCEVCRWLDCQAATLFAVMQDRDLLPPVSTPIRPGTPAWGALMRLCGVRAS